MVSFLKKLFGGTDSADVRPAERGDPVEHKGYQIQPAPEPEGDQWRLAGFVCDTSGAEPKERKFLRADLFSSRDEAEEFAIRKGKQIVDEQGARLFADGEPSGRA